jgi:hypothetical protein
VAWRFGDFIFNSGFDNITSTIKARRAGFHDCIDTEDMFSHLFDDLRQKRVIPRLSLQVSTVKLNDLIKQKPNPADL